MRKADRWMVCLALGICFTARAQVVDATHIGTPIDLSSETWRFATTDDPRYADPNFDDSHWKPLLPSKGFKAQGYAIPNGMYWVRVHVRIIPGTRNMAITTRVNSYQVYVSGQLIGQQGGFPDRPRESSTMLEQCYPIPDIAAAGDSMVIAIRVWQNVTGFDLPDLPFTFYRIRLGDQTLLQEGVTRSRYSIFLAYFGDVARGILAFIVAVAALALFRAQPEHREYLWLAIMGLSNAVWACIVVPTAVNQILWWQTILPESTLTALFDVAFVLFACAFLRVRVNGWIWAYCFALLSGPFIDLSTALDWVPWNYSFWADLVLSTPPDLFAPVLAIRQIRRGDREAAILLLPLFLLAAADYAQYLNILFSLKAPLNGVSLIPILRLGPAHVGPIMMSGIFFYLSIGGIMLHRSMRIAREQQRAAAELEAGRNVQTFLLGRDASAPGYTVESAYLPAQEVGGDFFQTIASADGSLVAVIGDVAGKGLQAAMRVSMLIGAVRLSPELTPAALLGKLNEVLLQDESTGFTTCLAVRLDADGTASISNAGHLSPYLNGCELPVDGGLPLGVAPGADYAEQTFLFTAGDTLLLISDGVVEATSPAGELFGFPRMAEAAPAITAANTLAESARAFGHQDDITVLLLRRATTQVLVPVDLV